MALTLVSGRMLANGSVTAEKLDGGAIATSNIAANSVNSVAIVDRSIQQIILDYM